jgi:glycosyltransferase involved in cell wall biosynthesis
MPSVSIVTASLNASATIRACLASIDAQRDCEHIVVDGASTDGTGAVVNAAARPGRCLLSGPDGGLYDAINKGIAAASGDIIGTLNADDRYPHAQVLDKVIDAFADPAIDVTYGDLVYENVDRRPVRRWRSGAYSAGLFYRGWMPPHPTFFVRRSAYERLGVFRTDLGTAADYELMLRFLVKERVRVAYIPDVLVHMRTGGVSNRSLLARFRANRMDRAAWRVNDLAPRPWTLMMKPLRKLPQWLFR